MTNPTLEPPDEIRQCLLADLEAARVRVEHELAAIDEAKAAAFEAYTAAVNAAWVNAYQRRNSTWLGGM
jgi:hypothetical protein